MLWAVLSVLVGVYADRKGRSGVGFFVLSLVLSPLVGFVVAFVEPCREKTAAKSGTKKCPDCGEYVRQEAIICRFCGHGFWAAASEAEGAGCAPGLAGCGLRAARTSEAGVDAPKSGSQGGPVGGGSGPSGSGSGQAWRRWRGLQAFVGIVAFTALVSIAGSLFYRDRARGALPENSKTRSAAQTEVEKAINSEQDVGCFRLQNPTTECMAILGRLGFSAGFIRSSWTAFHCVDAWWSAAHGVPGDKFDRSVYRDKVLPSLRRAKNLAKKGTEKAFLVHVSGASAFFLLYDTYSGFQDNALPPDTLKAFRSLTGTTPEEFAKAALASADGCMMAAAHDLGANTLTGEWQNADSVCSREYGLLQSTHVPDIR